MTFICNQVVWGRTKIHFVNVLSLYRTSFLWDVHVMLQYTKSTKRAMYYEPVWASKPLWACWLQVKKRVESEGGKPIWLCSAFPALCFWEDIDFGPHLAAPGCRSSEVPATPRKEANAASSNTKTTVGYGGQTQNTGHLCLSLCS